MPPRGTVHNPVRDTVRIFVKDGLSRVGSVPVIGAAHRASADDGKFDHWRHPFRRHQHVGPRSKPVVDLHAHGIPGQGKDALVDLGVGDHDVLGGGAHQQDVVLAVGGAVDFLDHGVQVRVVAENHEVPLELALGRLDGHLAGALGLFHQDGHDLTGEHTDDADARDEHHGDLDAT